MHRGFPNWTYQEMVEKVVITKNMRDNLVKYGFLIREPGIINGKKIERYMLGPTALSTVSSWNSEELSKRIHNLTVFLVFLTFVLIVIAIF